MEYEDKPHHEQSAKVLSVTGDRCQLMLHGETIPFLVSQCKLIPPPPKE